MKHGWREFRTLTEAKCEKYGREFRVINRWEPTSQKCSCCGFRGGKKELNLREWTCLNCGAFHDRDVNAAVNILNVVSETVTQLITKVEETVELENLVQLSLFVSVAPPQEAVVADGQPETLNKTRRRGKSSPKKDVSLRDMKRISESSTHPEFFQRASV